MLHVVSVPLSMPVHEEPVRMSNLKHVEFEAIHHLYSLVLCMSMMSGLDTSSMMCMNLGIHSMLHAARAREGV